MAFNGLITRIGTAKPDSEMPLYDKKAKTSYQPGPSYWRTVDKVFGEIESPIQQKANNNNVNAFEIPIHTPISSQGRLGSCVANAWCDALEILQGVKNPNGVVQLSRLFLYWLARDLVGTQDKDDGSYIRAAAQQLKNIGVVEEKYFPYNELKAFVPPEADLYTMASNNRISSFYKINSHTQHRLKDIENAVRACYPVVLSMEVGLDFMNYNGQTGLLEYPVRDKDTGYHAMIICGVAYFGGRLGFKVRNSWSERWGDKGYGWVSGDYVAHHTTNDIWVGTDINLI